MSDSSIYSTNWPVKLVPSERPTRPGRMLVLCPKNLRRRTDPCLWLQRLCVKVRTGSEWFRYVNMGAFLHLLECRDASPIVAAEKATSRLVQLLPGETGEGDGGSGALLIAGAGWFSCTAFSHCLGRYWSEDVRVKAWSIDTEDHDRCVWVSSCCNIG